MALSPQQSSRMSITQLCNSDEPEEQHEHNTSDIDDPAVKLAAEALGDMARSNTTVDAPNPMRLPSMSAFPSAPSTTPSSPLPTPSSSVSNPRYSFSSDSTQEDDQRPQQQPHFMHRVSNIPIVNNALRVYENSKASNSVVKYGAEMVESFASPIYDKFGKRALSGVDKWGCKQLDKLEERYPAYVNPNDQEDDAVATAHALARTSLSDEPEHETIRRRRHEDDAYGMKSRPRPCSRSTSPRRPYTLAPKSSAPNRHRSQPISKSAWHQIVMHAGSAAGTTAAVISEESMKCLRYCLSWLQYASQHIDQQMNILRNFLVSLATQKDEDSKSKTVAIPNSATATLAAIKKEIIDTLRKVVEVVSKYAGSGLPEQAKASVRQFILALPSRWATLNTSSTVSPTASPALHPHSSPHVHETSIRLLNFGGESLEMLQSVSNVFSDTIDRAELWLERLRVVGVAGAHSRTENKPESERMDLS
ncbi:hypothetical protein DFQ28_002224 [Apophysomyces sp. BC1034]|nr:hypothetical protein DFQ30_003650 [Apophysomyces sp. BC1015]KAG0179780.1 hypothetical protein DFQ29_001660 [Apophysomyces sp. BC1021]KAG0190305.1 hypothetical protein DFQ28_002224 [Apophysomyces sp. BC1034]